MKSAVTVLFLLRRMDCNDGVASYCETIISGLAARGDKVVIVSGPVTEFYGSAPRRAAITAAAAAWIVLDGLSSKIPTPGVIRRILSIMHEHKVDVISPQGLALLPLTSVLSLFSRRPVVANYLPSMGGSSLTAVATELTSKTKFLYRVLLLVCRPACLIAISKAIVDFYHSDCDVPLQRIAMSALGVDLKTFAPPTLSQAAAARETLGVSPTALVCVLQGRLNFNKGHDVVVDAVRILRRIAPALEVTCLFGGGGDQETEIKDYAFKDEADKAVFRFLGFLPGGDALRNVYWASDVALLPSRFEGFALVIAEAMGCGCVPIRTRSGGWQDQIVDGSNGFLIPFNDPQALAERILELSDPARRAAMRKEAIDFAQKNLGRDRMVEATSDLYRRVAA